MLIYDVFFFPWFLSYSAPYSPLDLFTCFQIHDYSSMAPLDDKDDLEDCTDPATEKMRRIIDDVLLAQQTALEIFTNICCDETSGEWEDAESVSI